MRWVTSDKAHRTVILVGPKATIVVTDSDSSIALADFFEWPFASNPTVLDFMGITAKVEEKMDKKFSYPQRALFPQHGFRNTTSSELHSKIL